MAPSNDIPSMLYMPSILETLRCRPVTVVSATYDSSGQLHQSVISGPKLASSCLPEEGIYVLYRNRGLQIASACDRRKCYITQVCLCRAEEYQQQQQHLSSVRGHTTTTTTFAIASTNAAKTEPQSPRAMAKRFMHQRAMAWLNLYKAADEIRSLRFCFLAHPRTLSWDNNNNNNTVLDTPAFQFDSELEEQYASMHMHGYRGAPAVVNKGCPRGLLGFARDTWREFLEGGDYDGKRVAGLGFAKPKPNIDDDYDEWTEQGEDEDIAYDGDVDDLSDWDDADTPVHIPVHNHNHNHGYVQTSLASSTALPNTSTHHGKKRPRNEEDEFDFIDDLIEEEFPRLKSRETPPPVDQDLEHRTENAKQQQQRDTYSRGRPEKMHKANSETKPDVANNNITGTSKVVAAPDNPHRETPAPVIIPPKNMLIGRGLADCLRSNPPQQGLGSYDNGYAYTHTRTRLGQPVGAVDMPVALSRRGIAC